MFYTATDRIWVTPISIPIELQKTLRGHDGMVFALTQLKDGTLATASDYAAIRLWDVKTGLCTKTLKGHNDSVYTLTLLKDGTLSSGSRDNTIKLWK